MVFSEEEISKMMTLTSEITDRYLLTHEKQIFDDFLEVMELTTNEYFKLSFGLLYEKDNQLELNTLELSSIPSTSKELSEDENSKAMAFYELTPQIMAITAEMIRQEFDAATVIDYYQFNLRTANKLRDRLHKDDHHILDNWIETIRVRIDDLYYDLDYLRSLPKQTTINTQQPYYSPCENNHKLEEIINNFIEEGIISEFGQNCPSVSELFNRGENSHFLNWKRPLSELAYFSILLYEKPLFRNTPIGDIIISIFVVDGSPINRRNLQKRLSDGFTNINMTFDLPPRGWKYIRDIFQKSEY